MVAPQMHPRRTHRAAWTWFAALVLGQRLAVRIASGVRRPVPRKSTSSRCRTIATASPRCRRTSSVTRARNKRREFRFSTDRVTARRATRTVVSGRGGIRLRLYECSAPHEYKRTVQRNSTSLRLGGLFCSGRGATGALANGPRQGIEIERFSQVGCVLVSEDLLDL